MNPPKSREAIWEREARHFLPPGVKGKNGKLY